MSWFQPAAVDLDAPLRLFLFHYAGAGSSVYHDWFGLLPADVAAQAIQLPGRQERRAEPTHTEVGSLVTALVDEFVPELDGRPYALFGHSMGALVAYRLALALTAEGDGPALLGVSGWTPAGFAMPTAADAALPDEGIVARMRELGALPGHADPDMLALAVPAMRADVAVCASYVDDDAKLDCPVVAYSGAADRLMSPAAMAAWAARSPDYLGNRVFPGGHFFVDEQALAITTDLVPLLRRHA